MGWSASQLCYLPFPAASARISVAFLPVWSLREHACSSAQGGWIPQAFLEHLVFPLEVSLGRQVRQQRISPGCGEGGDGGGHRILRMHRSGPFSLRILRISSPPLLTGGRGSQIVIPALRVIECWEFTEHSLFSMPCILFCSRGLGAPHSVNEGSEAH